jgi:reversibly glycosylated polypeptide/UDP-arabinopyranose mutase
VRKVLVIPSCREPCLRAFLSAWDGPEGDWDEIVLVEDNPTRTFQLPASSKPIHHYAWEEIEQILGDDSWIISRRDSAIRSFGFLMAWRLGATHILTLDDDCFPHAETGPICAGHIEAMECSTRWIPSVPGMRTRGLPYRNLGKLPNVVASMGYWSRIPDLDAIQSLNDLDFATNGRFQPRLVPSGQFFPLCGMNFCFRAEVVPLLWFPLMGEGSPFRRFDDIWAGLVLKRVADHLGMAVSVGEPFVEHQRASDVMANLVKEAPGVAFNEHLWERVLAVPLSAATPVGCVLELGRGLQGEDNEYVSRMGEALRVWAGLF